jgi:hypothetical protein
VEPIVKPYELLLVSSVSEDGLDVLKERITKVQGHSFIIEAVMPLTDEVYSLASNLRSSAEISLKVVGGHAEVLVRCKPEDSEKIISRLNGAGAVKISSNSEFSEIPSHRELQSSGNEGAPLP